MISLFPLRKTLSYVYESYEKLLSNNHFRVSILLCLIVVKNTDIQYGKLLSNNHFRFSKLPL
jgi:hypothetical protein